MYLILIANKTNKQTNFLLDSKSVTERHKVVRFEVYTAVTMKNGVFWELTPRGSCKNRRFGGT
jgi:hypothetical protein